MATATILRPIEQRWVCPNCTETAVTFEPRIHTRFHACRGLKGVTAPMVPPGVRAKVVANEREDYVGADVPQTDGEGVPIMSVSTVTEDSEDCTVLAPTSRMR